MSTGFVLNIPQEMINRLEDADKKIEKLARTSEDAQTRIVSAFKSINTHGIDAFINKLTEAQTKLSQLGSTQINMGVNANAFSGLVTQAQNAIDEVNRVVTAISKVKRASGDTGMAKNPFAGMSESLKQWNNLQSQIDATDAKIKKLTSTTMDYERQMQRMRSGQTTPINISYNEYAYTKERIAALQEEKRVLREKQEEITRQNNALSEQVRIQESLKRFVANQDSLPNRRSRNDYENLRRQLAEEEKASEKAEKKRVKDVEKAEKEAAKIREAERKKREKEEKATADRIAAYDSKTRRERYKAYTTTYEGAMRTSDRAKTLLQEQQAIKNLEAARAKLNKTDSDYANKLRNLNQRILEHKNNIDKATAGSKNLQTQHRSLMDISGQLARRLALVFSVSQITGYVKKLIEVRGEFELQQRSLQAILQNKDEANRIWQQTVDLAVRSPFRVKELVSYTKQLAAYRIESDKLFETNKMLADISAGLGVDMQRLILAFGQVRSAAYLRGTELRQFTEAGIPILEQLAQYFTELEGRAVSVGDVFERVSKRMVSFADVEEIFRRMTSEGGTFFKMQEIQAGTLKGLWSNLKDSVDIMLNEIGKDSESMLKKSLAFVKRLVDNWSELKPIIESAGITFFAYFGTKALNKIAKGFKTLTTLMSANPYLTAAAAATVLLTTLLQVAKAQDELNAAMSEIENENKKALEENIGLYLKLAETINDATKSTKERNKALENLRENFKDILPDQYLELEYIRSISDNYDAATDAMINYYNAKTIQQKKDKIESEFSEELEGTDIPELTDAIKALIVSSDEIGDKAKTKLVAGVSYAVNGVVEEVKSGKLDPSFNAIKEAIEEKLLAYSGEDFDLTPFMDKLWISPLLHTEELAVKKNLGDIMQTLIEYRYRMGDVITGLQLGDTFEEDLAGNAIAEYKEYVNELESAANKLFNLADGFSKQPVGRDATDLILDIVGDLNVPDSFKNQFEPLLLSYANELFLGAKGGEFEFKSLSSSLQEKWKASIALVWSGFAKQTADSNKEGAKELADLMWNEMDKAIEESAGLELSDFQIEVDKVFREAAKELSVTDLDIFKGFIPDSKKSRTALIKDLNTTVEQYKQNIEEWEQIINRGGSIDAATILTQFSEEAINQMRIAIPLLTLTAEKLGHVNKQTSPDRNKGIEARINVIKQLNSKYKELNKTLSDTESLEGAFAAYKDAFATAYGREDVRKMTAEEFAKNVLNFPDEDAIVAWLDNLAKTVKGKENKLKAELAKGEFEMDVKVRLKEEEDKELLDDIQKLFDQYDLSLELKNLGIPPKLGESLFGVKSSTLKELRESVTDAFMGVEFYNERIKDAGKLMEDTFNGNVDLLNRKLIPAQQLAAKGWQDVGDGLATVFSSSYSVTDASGKQVDILVTPILPDGTVMSEKELEEYISKNLEGAKDVLKADKKGIVIHAGVDMDEGMGEYLHSLQEVFYASDMLSEDQKKKFKDFLDKIDDLEEKQQLESAKRFAKFLTQNLDQTKVVLQQRGIDIAFAKKEFDEGRISAEQFAETVKNIVAQSNEEISKFNLEKFKETPEYIQAMGDLASYSKKEIQTLIKTLNDAVTQNAHLFDADEVKAYMDALKKAQEELESRDVFKWGDFGRAADIIQTQKEIEDKKADIETNKAELETQKQKLAELQAKLDNLKAQQKATQDAGGDTTQVDADIAKTTSDIVTANEEIGKTNNEIKTNTGLLSLLGDKMKGLAGNMGTTLAIIDAIVHGINDTVQGINTLYGEIGSVMESFGKETDFSTGFGKGAMLMDTFAKSSQAAADGWDAFKNGDPVGVVVNVVKSITEIIKGINAYHDAGLEVIIQDHLKEVERLQKEYEKLEWAIDRAFSFKKYGMVAEQQENLAKQIENTQKAIAAEEDKKDTDKERIEELQGEIEEASKQIQELYDNLRADIVGTFEDLSSTLGDAMISALQQGEDALKAWSDSVNDIITDIVGQLLIQKYLEPQIANLVNDYYSKIMPKNARAENKYQEYLKAIERGDSATAEKLIEEYKKLAEQAIGEVPQINEDATKQFQSDLLAAGENFKDLIPDWLINSTKEGGGLSALQKGISGMSEQQAEILTAYWNSVRGYTASIDSKMDLILANMGVGVENNPILDQLVSQTNILTKIHGILEDVASNSQRTFKTSLL